ncbi:Fic family protein [Dyadobacter pollutisoli]|uniref:Fic family protein n=1 Tax=Dyadobacter pollutisoli TaxID=2910158 RepID=A0A9E8SM04_9BACT|nr:Fic family protein [Dyadobacter pollutisoli]WAC14205.1 Fic family protein [Dyadobacter pollutisoli]
MEPVERAVLLKRELDALLPISREQELRIMQKFRLDWNYHSNRIEGNSLTYGETKALIMFGLTAQGKPLKDHIEIEGHNEAIEWILDIVKGDYPLNESFIREIHTLLLKESYTVDAITAEGLPTKKRVEIGKYKSQPNHVLTNTGEIFRFATPEETPAMMGDLIEWYREKISQEDLNPVLLAAEFHYKFTRIHPFDDGNGRTARILMNFILMRYQFPPVIIKTEEKNQYFSALRQADSGIFMPFLDFSANNLAQSVDLMIRGAKGESIEEEDDFDKELALLERRLSTQSKELKKSVELLHLLYDNSIIPLFQKFHAGAEKFDGFYVASKHYFRSSEFIGNFNSAAILKFKQQISIAITEFKVISSYKTFIHSEYGIFNFLSKIEVMLGPDNYIVKSYGGSMSFEKSYGEQLSEKEIADLVKSELTRHKDFIESKTKKTS